MFDVSICSPFFVSTKVARGAQPVKKFCRLKSPVALEELISMSMLSCDVSTKCANVQLSAHSYVIGWYELLIIKCSVNWSLYRIRTHHWLLLVLEATQQLLIYLPAEKLMWMILIGYVSSVIEFIFYWIHFPLMIWCLYGDSCHGDIGNIHVYISYKHL